MHTGYDKVKNTIIGIMGNREKRLRNARFAKLHEKLTENL